MPLGDRRRAAFGAAAGGGAKVVAARDAEAAASPDGGPYQPSYRGERRERDECEHDEPEGKPDRHLADGPRGERSPRVAEPQPVPEPCRRSSVGRGTGTAPVEVQADVRRPLAVARDPKHAHHAAFDRHLGCHGRRRRVLPRPSRVLPHEVTPRPQRADGGEARRPADDQADREQPAGGAAHRRGGYRAAGGRVSPGGRRGLPNWPPLPSPPPCRTRGSGRGWRGGRSHSWGSGRRCGGGPRATGGDGGRATPRGAWP
jgi:hypothetical protein